MIRFRRVLATSWLIALAFFGYGCDTSDSNDGPPPGPVSYVKADIDGLAYSSLEPSWFVNVGILMVASETTSRDLNFATLDGVGTKTIGLGSPAACQVEFGTEVWKASEGVGSGSFTIASISNSGGLQVYEGTFNCVAQAFSGGATGSKVVTNGTFQLVR